MANWRSPKYLAAARDQPCARCGAQDGTVVAAHSNRQQHGKGMGIKAHDIFVADLCRRCHDWYDGRGSVTESSDERQIEWQQAHEVTLLNRLKRGIIK